MEKQQNPAQTRQRFESDTQKIVRRHLADPNHVITDEEIASIRVGMTPPEAFVQQDLRRADDYIAE